MDTPKVGIKHQSINQSRWIHTKSCYTIIQICG